MTSPCTTLRETLLPESGRESLADADREHLAACEGCGVWFRRLEAAAEALRSLPRRPVPSALERLVAAELEGLRHEQRFERLFAELPETPAPAILEDLVFDSVPTDGVPLMRALRRLPRVKAPAVLDRLVEEELAAPAAHRTRRFVGDLERQSGPAEMADLEERMRRVRDRGAPRMRLLVPVSGFAAAALVLWVSMFSSGQPEPRPTYSFRVVRAQSLDELGSTARWFADGLAGGSLSALPREWGPR